MHVQYINHVCYNHFYIGERLYLYEPYWYNTTKELSSRKLYGKWEDNSKNVEMWLYGHGGYHCEIYTRWLTYNNKHFDYQF